MQQSADSPLADLAAVVRELGTLVAPSPVLTTGVTVERGTTVCTVRVVLPPTTVLFEGTGATLADAARAALVTLDAETRRGWAAGERQSRRAAPA